MGPHASGTGPVAREVLSSGRRRRGERARTAERAQHPLVGDEGVARVEAGTVTVLLGEEGCGTHGGQLVEEHDLLESA